MGGLMGQNSARQDRKMQKEFEEENGPPLTLEQKLMRAFGDRLMAQYGPDSNEVETMEDAMDFDIDGDGDIAGTPYIVELDPVRDLPNETLEEPPAEPPAEPPPELPAEPTPP